MVDTSTTGTVPASRLDEPVRPRAGDRPGHRSRRAWSPVRWVRSGGWSVLLMALPFLVVFGVFSWYPIARGLVMSVQSTNLVAAPEWVGVENFGYVLSDPKLSTAVGNTVWFAVLALLFGFPLPLLMAVFITELRRGKWLFSLLAYLPAVVPPVVAILLWKFFFDPAPTGVFNTLLAPFGLGPFPWLNDPLSAMPSIVLEATWAGMGGTVIIYLACLAGVRTELYEAAELDGAGIWSRVWHITFPQMRGVILIMLLLQVIGTLQVFTEPFLFTNGGPRNATLTVLLLVYEYAFVSGDYGAATALSVLLAVVLAVLAGLYQLLTRRWAGE